MAEGERRGDLCDAPVENLRRRPFHGRGGERPVRRPDATFQTSPFTAEDIRFTQSKDGKTLYAIVLEIPDGRQSHRQIAGEQFAANWPGKIGSVRLVGSWGKLKFTRDETGLHVTLPEKFDGKTAFALKIQS